MAKTSKGIYYPYDYNAIADVPEDMKQMAESINKIVENEESNINTNTARITQLEQKKDMLSQQMPWNTLQGESIHIQDASLWDENKLSLSGNMKQEKRSGKNKFKIPESATSNGVTLTNNGDGSFTLNGTTTGIAIFSATLNNPLKIGTYTISYKSSVALENSFFLRVRDKNNTLVHPTDPVSQVIGNNSTHNSATYTSDVESAIVAINLTKAGVTYNNVVIYPQLEEGSVETDWEQYGTMPSTEFPSMPLVCSGVQKIITCKDNLFNKNTVKLGQYIDVSGNEVSFDVWCTTDYIVVKPNEECYYSGIVSAGNAPYSAFYDENKRLINTFKQSTGKKVITIPENAKYVRFSLKTKDSDDRETFYIKHGNAAADYEPYTEEINTLDLGSTELCKIMNGDTVVAQDRAVYRNVDGVWKWQWEKIIKKLVLNGTESWTMTSLGFFACTSLVKNYALNNNNIVCTHFKGRINVNNSNELELEEIAFNDNINYSRLYIHTLQFTTAEELKTWLSNNNVTLYYVLETPIYTDCTADQSAILDKLYNNFKLNKGVNNIIVETDNGVGVNMELTYMQDNVLRHDKDIAELKQAIVALGGVI